MDIFSISHALRSTAIDFAWDEWSQMGVYGQAHMESGWAQDPEALVVFTLEVARHDARLFDELLDWLLLNESHISARRLRSMCADDEDEQLVEATLELLRARRRRWKPSVRRPGPSVPLFRGVSTRIREEDPTFAAHGLQRPAFVPGGKSESPNTLRPINFAFRLRQIFGVSARAEVARVLLTLDVPWVTAPVVARSAGYAKRNVQEALSALHAAAVIDVYTVGAEQRYSIDRDRWGRFLGQHPVELPDHLDWPQLLRAARLTLRWLQRAQEERASDYMLTSRARDLLEEIQPDLTYAGVSVDFGRTAHDALLAVEDVTGWLSAFFGRGRSAPIIESVEQRERAGSSPSMGRFEIVNTPDSTYRWQLKARNGRLVAVSAAYNSRREAIESARLMKDRAGEWWYDVYADDGGYHWRARTPDGELVALSPESFASRFNAKRAVESARETAQRSRGT